LADNFQNYFQVREEENFENFVTDDFIAEEKKAK